MHTSSIHHDALYRVIGADYGYRQDDSSYTPTDPATDWRAERTRHNADGTTHETADPMRERPAAMLPTLPAARPVSMTWEYDWLANMVEWTDDASSFYERSLDRISNGFDEGLRPSALYFASSLPSSAPPYSPTAVRGGWLELDYGDSGNVVAMTVRGECRDASPTQLCYLINPAA